MTVYEIEPPAGPERGVVVRCPVHEESTEFPLGELGGTFYCPDCGLEVQARLNDPTDWRDWGEWC